MAAREEDFASVWVRCACGKEWQARKDWPFPADTQLTFSCKACEADLAEHLDSCMESVRLPHGVSACRLPRRHVGRCQPYEPGLSDAEEDR